MREYQVSFGKYVSKAELPALLKQLGYQGGAGGEGIILESVTTWYLKTRLDSDVTRETDPTEWRDYFTPPDPSKRFVWRYMDYWYTTNHHTPDFHVYTDCELVTMYSSGGGMGVEFAYALFDKEVSGVTVLNEGEGDTPDTYPSATWTKDLDTLIYNANQYLWMSQRIIDGETVGPWQKPIRISGKDGDPGADALDTEFIYKLMGRKPNSNEPIPVTENPLVNRNKDDYYPESDGWSDCPQGVEDDGLHNFEWMSYRTLLTEDDPDYGTYKWSEFSTPIIWSAYGEKGMDGDGIEYVYKHVLDITNFEAPASPKFYAAGGDIITWYGGVTLKNPGNPNNSNDWLPKDYNSSSGAFEYWIGGKYGPQGEWIPKIDPDGGNEDSNFWSDDPEGVGYFIRYQQNGQPVLDGDNNPVQDLYKYEYVTSRKRVNEEWGEFSEPKIWSTFSKEHTITIEYINGKWVWVIDGEPTTVVAEGQNGKGIDLKGRVTFYSVEEAEDYLEDHPGETVTTLEEAEDDFELTENNVGDCFVVEEGENGGHIYLYLDGDDENWWKHWQDFGEFQGEGSYVHIAWANGLQFDPNDHTTITGYSEFAVDRDADGTYYEWMGICTDHSEDDPGSNKINEYKWNHVRGRDGDTFEKVYMRTAVEVRPLIAEDQTDSHGHTHDQAEYLPYVTNIADNLNVDPPIHNCQPDPTTNQGTQQEPRYEFTDDPQGVDSTYRYEWMAERKKSDGQWQSFGRASLWATYSNDGQSILRSTIFKRSESKPDPPAAPGSFSQPVPENSGWSNGIPPGTGPIWKTEKIFTSDNQPPQWQNWSDPTLVRDDENFDVELSTQAKDINGGPVAPVKYNEATSDPYLPCNSHRPLSGEEGYDESIPVVDQIWFDPELDSGYISEHSNLFNWMATRSRYVTVQGQPAWRPWTIILVKGEDGGTGASGIGFQHAYIAVPKNGTPNIQEDSNHPGTYISTNSGATGTWTIGTNGVSVQAGQALWMSERTVHDGIYGPWGTPVRLSGPDGSPGEDAENIEFIYKRSNRLPNNSSGNSDKPTLNDYTVDEYIPNYDLHSNDDGVSPSDNIPQNQDWTDSPFGVDPDHKYEWMCQRIKPRTTDPDELWDDWSDVFVWSAYGDTGMDGDGVEYIFYRRNTKPYTPVGPHYRAVEGGSITEWKGGVVNVAEEGETPEWEPKDLTGSFYEWVYGSYNSQGEWIPTHWYTSSSTIGAVGNSIRWTDEPTGVGEETNPDWDSEDPESSPTITYLYEWVSVRKRVGGEWGKFSEPTQWSNYAVTPIITIEDGVWVINGEPTEHSAEGPAGQGIQLKDTVTYYDSDDRDDYLEDHEDDLDDPYTFLSSINPTTTPTLTVGDCYVVKSSRFLYVSLYNGSNWNSVDWTKNWDEIGEFQGAPGTNSYMHIAWAASKDTDPVKINGVEYTVRGDNLNFDGSGNLTLIKKFLTQYEQKNPAIEYDWMGVRTDNDILDPVSNFELNRDLSNGVYEDYAIAHPEEFNWSLYKWNNVRGRDGDNYERVYIRTKTETPKPTVNQDSYGEGEHQVQTEDEFLPQVNSYNSANHSSPTFTDDPVGVTNTYKFEWMAERRKALDTSTGKVRWFDFSAPSLWAKYSTNGTDGVSVQIKYAAVPVSEGLTITSASVNTGTPVGEYTLNGTTVSNVGWADNTSGFDLSSEVFLWMTQRTVRGSTVVTNWLNPPIRISGEDGDPGRDGRNIEFVFRLASAPPSNPTDKPGTLDYNNKSYNDDDYIPEGWTDNPTGVDNTSAHKYEWACQRVKPSGPTGTTSWGSWSDVFVWSAYGDKGMDGDGVEYVFFLWDGPSNATDTYKYLVTPASPTAVEDDLETTRVWRGEVEAVGNPNVPSNWKPKNWPSSYGTFHHWDGDAGYYNSQGEWIPRLWVTDNDPEHSYRNPNNGDSAYWSDDPIGIDMYHIREWVSVRKRIGGEWKDFCEPKLWASFGSDVKIQGGRWIINGKDCGKAEGEDGQGVAIKGTVDVVLTKDKNGDSSKSSLQEINPKHDTSNPQKWQDIAPGDCYVVKEDRHLYVSLHDKEDWVSGDDWNADNWDFHDNWEDVGEFQGEGSYMHIAWATDAEVIIENGEISYITHYEVDFARLQSNLEYNWIGICTDHDEDDPVSNYDVETYDPEHDIGTNWKKYKWNHVKGKDGSDHERVYLRTKTNTTPEFSSTQNSYTKNGNIYTIDGDEYLPAVKNYTTAQHSGTVISGTGRFTDDPVGVKLLWPFEWMSERHKKYDTTTGRMKWFGFSTPSLWATYSSDGMTVGLSNNTAVVHIDAADNIVYGLGDSTNGWRLHTEVILWDPKKNNGAGGNLSYSSNEYSLTVEKSPSFITTEINSSTGVISITSLGTKAQIRTLEECILTITATISTGKSFTFPYKVTVIHMEQTYLTYSLSNTYDSITYRTKTAKYDGLPVTTQLKAQINGKTIGVTSEIPFTSGYMKSVTVESDLLTYATETGISDSKITLTSTYTYDSTEDTATVTYGTKNNIYVRNSAGTDTGLRLSLSSNGTVELKRKTTTGTDVDLPDAKHYVKLTCVVSYQGVDYQSIMKEFTLEERTDSTLYDLILSATEVKEVLGTYTPNAITAKATVSDETGLSTITPSTNSGMEGRIGSVGSMYVKFYKDKASNLPSTGTSGFYYPCNLSVLNSTSNNTVTGVIVDFSNSSSALVYHDIQEISISHEVPESYIDLSPDKYIVDCSSQGKVLVTKTLTVTAYLKWGGITVTGDKLVSGSCSMSPTMGGTYTSPSQLTINSDGSVTGAFKFTAGNSLTSGVINVTLAAQSGNSSTTAHATVEVTANDDPTSASKIVTNHEIFVFETDPLGKIATSAVPSEAERTLTARLKVEGTTQTPTSASISYTSFANVENPETISSTLTSFSGTSGDKYASWVLNIPTNVELVKRDITITMSNATYSATKVISATFTRKNRSSFKSFVFKRFASAASVVAPTTGATGGSYENNGIPNGASGTADYGWSDGLPADGGTDPIYMSSRTFYSDNSQSTSWSTPVMMSDTETFNVEFSPQNSQPVAPNGSNQNGGSGTQIWFDPVLDKYTDSTHTTLRDFTQMKWMATSTSKDNNGNWTNWVVVRIKGETGESQHIDSTDAYYKIFDTLDVQMPADDDEEGLAAWTTTQIEPTEELPYLWRFFRTEYSNPSRAENYGLELVQVWSENMINPNLFDNPDFDVEDVRPNGLIWPYSGTSDAGGTMGAWTTWQVSNTQFWTSWGKNYGLGSNYPEVGPENGYNYYGGIHDVNTNLSGTGYVVVLKQFIYKKEDSTFINKISAGNWYTLSFWMKGFSNFHDDSLQVKILSRNSSNTNSSGTGLLDNTSSNKVYVNNTAYTTSTSIISFSYSNTLSYNKFNSSWNKYTITFKIKDSIPNDVNTCHIEWTLSVSNPATKKGGILLSKPKLEVGKLATRYISSRIKDPYPRVTGWKVGEMYYQGRYGEPYLDIVSYEGQWFRCRLTHISNDGICTSSGHLGEYNSSVDFRPIIGTTNTWWEPANNFNFISTNLLLADTAFINNLIATKVRTGQMGTPHVEMHDSTVEFYGNLSTPSIVLDVDDEQDPTSPYYGAGILRFYDSEFNELYNLGPRGLIDLLHNVNNVPSKFITYRYKKIKSGDNLNAFLNVKDSDCTSYYQFIEGYTIVNGEKKYYLTNDSTPNPSYYRKLYSNNSLSSTGTNAHPTGTSVSGWFIDANNGVYTEAIQVSKRGIAPNAYDDSHFYVIIASKWESGSLTATRGVYFYKNDNVWRDEHGVMYGGYTGINIDIITYLDYGSAT